MPPDEVCEYCGQDPCDCPVFDIKEDPENPDDVICPDADEGLEEPDL